MTRSPARGTSFITSPALISAALALAACGDDGGGRDSLSAGGVSATAGATGGTGEATVGGSGSGSAGSGGTGAGSSTGAATGATAGSTGAGSTGGAACGAEMFSFEFQPATPNVMLVLDKSRSMSQLWDHDGDPNTPTVSRWSSLYAVVDAFTSAHEADMDLGAQLFPSASAYLDEPTNVFSCMVESPPEVPVGPNSAASIMAALPAADDLSISGGTPATAGVQSALDHLRSLPADEPRAMVLITDGAANCDPNQAADQTLFVYDDRLPSVVADAWAADAIPTYVVGINILDFQGTKPAVNPKEAVTMVAQAGGVPKAGPEPFYNTFNEQELGDAIASIAAKIPCTITLDSEPMYPDDVVVEIGATTYDPVADCATETGWSYTNANGPYNAIELCGLACDDFGVSGKVNITYDCP